MIVKYKDFQPLSIQTFNRRASGCRAWQSVFRQVPQVIQIPNSGSRVWESWKGELKMGLRGWWDAAVYGDGVGIIAGKCSSQQIRSSLGHVGCVHVCVSVCVYVCMRDLQLGGGAVPSSVGSPD